MSGLKVVGGAAGHDAARVGAGTLSPLMRAFRSVAGSREPLHLRLRNAILVVLAEAAWAPGDKLPAERDLAAEIGVSLGTVQKTLNGLAADGHLVRRHGYGTYVAGDASQAAQLAHFRFETADGTALAPVYAEAIERRIVRERGAWAQFLRDSEAALLITRRIHVGDEFDCISDFYIDAARFGAIMTLPIETLHKTVIRHFIARAFNAPTLSATQSVTAGPFPDRIRRLLKGGPGSQVGMTLQVRSRTHGEAPISFQQVYIPASARPLALPDPRLG